MKKSKLALGVAAVLAGLYGLSKWNKSSQLMKDVRSLGKGSQLALKPGTRDAMGQTVPEGLATVTGASGELLQVSITTGAGLLPGAYFVKPSDVALISAHMPNAPPVLPQN